MDWFTYGVPAVAAGLGVGGLAFVWLMSARFHRKHPQNGVVRGSQSAPY